MATITLEAATSVELYQMIAALHRGGPLGQIRDGIAGPEVAAELAEDTVEEKPKTKRKTTKKASAKKTADKKEDAAPEDEKSDDADAGTEPAEVSADELHEVFARVAKEVSSADAVKIVKEAGVSRIAEIPAEKRVEAYKQCQQALIKAGIK